jgi:hypothetical protein
MEVCARARKGCNLGPQRFQVDYTDGGKVHRLFYCGYHIHDVGRRIRIYAEQGPLTIIQTNPTPMLPAHLH